MLLSCPSYIYSSNAFFSQKLLNISLFIQFILIKQFTIPHLLPKKTSQYDQLLIDIKILYFFQAHNTPFLLQLGENNYLAFS